MKSKEVKAWTCSCCGKTYLNKSIAEGCCVEKPVRACEVCSKPLDKTDFHTLCSECRNEKARIKELERYNKATHYTFETAPKESIEYMFSELYPHNEGFMSDLEDCIEEDYGIKYVYGTHRVSPSYDAQDVINSMLEESYEGVEDHVEQKELNKLQEAIDMFVKNHGGSLDHFTVDYNIVIDLNLD